MEISFQELRQSLAPEEQSRLLNSLLGTIYKKNPKIRFEPAVRSFLRLCGTIYSHNPRSRNVVNCSKDKDGSIYCGEVDKFFHRTGRGLVVCQNGSIFQGHFEKNLRKGEGLLVLRTGLAFRGNWNAETLVDTATIINPINDRVYEGAVCHGFAHGEGRETNGDGSVFIGTFHKGQKHGYGKYKSPDGTQYKGHLQSGLFEGEGTYTYPNGNVYTGGWHLNKMHGVGVFRWANGDTYSGGYSNDLKEGFGRLDTKPVKYYGYWTNGKYDGLGIEITEGAQVRKGLWRTGALVQTVANPIFDAFEAETFQDADVTEELTQILNSFSDLDRAYRRVLIQVKQLPKVDLDPTVATTLARSWQDCGDALYKGQVDSTGIPHGVGVEATPKDVYQGGFRRGLRHGLGRHVSCSGDVYEGSWKRGRRHGFGEHRTEAGVYQGHWRRNSANGPGYYKTCDYEYSGDFFDDYFHGHGEIVFEDGSRFKGQFKRGRMSKGQFISSEGTTVKQRKKSRKGVSEEPTGIDLSQLGFH